MNASASTLRLVVSAFLSAVVLTTTATPTQAMAPTQLPGLDRPVTVIQDTEGIPHIYATTEQDAYYLLGYLHARDRYFAMDFYRHLFSGSLAELLGPGALSSDFQLRAFNLRTIAETNVDALPQVTQEWLQAYSDGINAYVQNNSLPIEYTLFELTHSSITPWTPADSILMWKGFAAGAWLDLKELQNTLTLFDYQAAASQNNDISFNGSSLYADDVHRSAPFVPAVIVPEGEGSRQSLRTAEPTALPNARGRSRIDSSYLRPETLELAAEYRRQALENRVLQEVIIETSKGSNWWLISGDLTEDGQPLFAGDPHQPVTMPTILYEAHLHVNGRPDERLNASGGTFPGIPVTVVGCSDHHCWSATNSSHDVSDIFQELVVFENGAPVATLYQGQAEPLNAVDYTFMANVIGDGVPDNPSTITQARFYYVPRRSNGPLLSIGTPVDGVAVGLSVQYVGWQPHLDLEGLRQLPRVDSPEAFNTAIEHIKEWILNFGYVDTDGNIAYRVSGSVPLRDDLQNLGTADGLPPFFLRDGTGTLHHEWLPEQESADPLNLQPYAILPTDEMPQVTNPRQGFIVSANNDPVGNTIDNDPINQLRPDGGIFYLGYQYAGIRAAKIQQQLGAMLSDDGFISLDEIRQVQSNSQMLDAEALLSFLLDAYTNATSGGADPQLAALATDPRVSEAIGRLANWDFSTPTGLQAGYDQGDDPTNLPAPSGQEIAYSVATTIYSVWRGQAIRQIIDAPLLALGFGQQTLPQDRVAMNSLYNLLQSFDLHEGFGASGIDFFPIEDVDRETARDMTLLRTLRDALDLLSGPAFANAFANSTNQDDYRWGKLHRITFNHLVLPTFSVPPAGGFQNVAPNLPGLAVDGGYATIDQANHNVRADNAAAFTFSVPPGRRGVASLSRSGVEALQILPGGNAGDPSNPYFTNQMGRYLTNQYAPVPLSVGEVISVRQTQDLFLPAH